MKWNIIIMGFVFLMFVTACATTGSGKGLSLQEAIEQSGEKIASEMPAGSRIAIVAFNSPNDNLSNYIMEELAGAFIDRNIEVADRQNLEFVYKELDFQISGEVSDESAQSIGKFLGAQLIVTGELSHIGSTYRFRTNAIHVENAIRVSVPRFDVRNDRAMQTMIATLSKQNNTVTIASYGVIENTIPKTAGAFLDLGIIFASRGDFDTAILDFSEAIKIDPNLSSAYQLRGRALRASVSYVTDISEDFSSFGLLYLDGKTVEQMQVYERAIADYTEAIKLDPNNFKIYRERGMAYTGNGDYNNAIVDFNNAIQLNPNYSDTYVNRSAVYILQDEYRKAIADSTQAIRINSNNDIAYTNRGIGYIALNDYERGIADYTQAIKLDPNVFNPYYCRGNAYYYLGDYNKAISDYNQAIRLDPNYFNAYVNRGNAYFNLGNNDRSIADYNQAIRLNLNLAIAYDCRGSVYNNTGNYDKAILDFEEALRLDPKNTAIKQKLEIARQNLGR